MGWVAVAGKGGLWGGFRWVVVAGSDGFHFWWIPVVLGEGFLLLFCFTLLQTHNVKYFLDHFPKVQTNIGKTNIFL